MIDRDNILNKVRHLLNKTTEQGCTEAEAEAACKVAQRLMDEYNIECAELISQPDSARVDLTEEVIFTSRWTSQSYLRAMPVIKFMFPIETYFYNPNYAGSHFRCVAFGDPTNIASAKATLNFLGGVFHRLWKGYRKAANAPTSDMTNYFVGLSTGLIAKLKADRKAAAEERAPGTGLAVIENSLQVLRTAVGTAFTEKHKDLKQTKLKVKASAAFAAGYVDGHNISLNKSIS